MKPNLSESQLRSWQPRRPSAGLKQRIFAAPHRQVSRAALWTLRCLAPAAACFVMALAALNQDGALSHASSRQDFMFGMIGSNRLAYLSGSFEQQENRALPVTFEWTNRSGSTSSTPFTRFNR